MQIDWLTVGAQIVNFLILVWLLQRFLYGPITRAMDRREQRIRDRLEEAEQQKSEAEAEARAYRDKQEDLERRRDHILTDARDNAEEERKSLEREAREEINTRKREWLRQLETERETFLRELRLRSTEAFYALARRALGDMASADLQEQIALSFTQQLEDLDESALDDIARSLRESGASVTIRSRFELPATAKRQITKTLHERLNDDAEVDYEARDDISCGIELKAGSRTVSWNFGSYLDGLEKTVDAQYSSVLVSAGESKDE